MKFKLFNVIWSFEEIAKYTEDNTIYGKFITGRYYTQYFVVHKIWRSYSRDCTLEVIIYRYKFSMEWKRS